MELIPHAPNSREPHVWLERARAMWRHVASIALFFAVAGCDIVQGFQEAGDSLFPEQSTHLASPGLRLVRGHYRNLGVIGGTEIHLLARGADDDTGTLFVMRYAEPRPCEIPRVVRFSATRAATRSAPLLSYFEEDVRSGTLRFADTSCRRFSLTFDDARLPIAETDASLVVWAGSELWLATPETGERELLAEGVESVTGGVFGGRYAVRANGRLIIFDGAWEEQGTFGDGVESVLRAGKSLFYVDSVGVHRIVASASGGVVEDELSVPGACSLATQDGTWIALRAPCNDGKLQVIHEPTGATFTLPFDADPNRLQLVPARGSAGRDPLADPFWFFYLRSGTEEGSEDTLFVRTPAGDERVIGARSTFLHLRLLESEAGTHGYALVDIAGETGRYVWWDESGEVRTLAEKTMWRPSRLFVDFDGTTGSLAVTSGDRLHVVARGVPWQAFEYQDPTRRWTVLFHDMQAGIGRLSVLPDGIDELEAAPDAPFDIPPLKEVAEDVVVFGTSSLNELLSGVAYLTNFDAETLTGRLMYRNLELRFTADVNHGVSDYLVANDEVLYAIPYGDDAGIWLVSGK